MFFLRDNLPRIKDGAYVINLDDRQSKGTYWVSLFITSFETEGISQEVLSKIKDKSVTHNIFTIQPSDSIMRGFCCIAFIELILVEKLC